MKFAFSQPHLQNKQRIINIKKQNIETGNAIKNIETGNGIKNIETGNAIFTNN